MRRVPGLLAKGGAEGVVAVAVPGVGAVAIKIETARCGRDPGAAVALRRLGVPAPADRRAGARRRRAGRRGPRGW
jgi:L-asparaginase II